MKIGIIGGGAAGLVTAWLLDQEHEVFLFEKESYLGGHAHTVYVSLDGKTVPIEIGFEFFNKRMFPHFCRLLKILSIKTHDYELTHTFYTEDGKQVITLPPFISKHLNLRNFSFSNIFILLQFKYLIYKAKKIVNSKITTITLEQFANSLWLTKSFKENFFYPFLCAGWGAEISKFKQFAAYDILTWAVKNETSGFTPKHWTEITQGTTAYIEALKNQLKSTNIQVSTEIKIITYESGKYYIEQATGKVDEVDHLILATNAQDAAELLKNINHADKAITQLKKIRYFHTALAIHSDSNFMPTRKEDWSVANARFDGFNSCLTIYKKWKSEIPLFRSWVTPYIDTPQLPQPLYYLKHFCHAQVDINYFQAQTALKELQGINNIWFAGLYTNDVDSHESAIVSAMKLAQQLAPQSERLAQLLKN